MLESDGFIFTKTVDGQRVQEKNQLGFNNYGTTTVSPAFSNIFISRRSPEITSS